MQSDVQLFALGTDVMLPNQMMVRCGSSAEAFFIYREIFEERCYAKGGLEVHMGGIVIDVGANIGLFGLWVAGGGAGGIPGSVLAVEPLLPNVEMLRHNLASHGLADQVRLGFYFQGLWLELNMYKASVSYTRRNCSG